MQGALPGLPTCLLACLPSWLLGAGVYTALQKEGRALNSLQAAESDNEAEQVALRWVLWR